VIGYTSKSYPCTVLSLTPSGHSVQTSTESLPISPSTLSFTYIKNNQVNLLSSSVLDMTVGLGFALPASF
jgi:hypothetical protein